MNNDMLEYNYLKHYNSTIGKDQIFSEFLLFLIFINSYFGNSVNYILEIGSLYGGTTIPFSWLTKNLINIDLNNPPLFDVNLIDLNCNYRCILEDSTTDKCYFSFKDIIQNDKLDILFIDGGHDYYTVDSDFKKYSSFVKFGGIIALHDINKFKDGKEIYGVPRFWRELKTQYRYYFEIIHTDNSFGIGVLINR